MCQSLFLAIGPHHFCLVNRVVTPQPEVQPEIALRQVTASADHFIRLHQVAGSYFNTSIQGQTVARGSFERKADPMIRGAMLGAQNRWFAYEVFDYCSRRPSLNRSPTARPRLTRGV